MRIVRVAAVILVLGLLSGPLAAQQGGWTPLFNGKDLDGWYPCNGTAPYTVENGDDRRPDGRRTRRTASSARRRQYGDFILEYEVWVDTNFNSGVQIRSIADPAVKNGRVHGLQVEVDPSERAWSGGIYDEARRGWLYTNEGQDGGASKAFKMKAWNTFRVEAIGTLDPHLGERRPGREHPRRPDAERRARAAGALHRVGRVEGRATSSASATSAS